MVRSSATAEDLDGASFAGLYETVLDVTGAEAIAGAVRQCWASVVSARVRCYEIGGGAQAARMAVLVQRLVRAECAGVAFTAHPVTGDRSQVVVSAVAGLGEKLVGGSETGEEWLVRGRRVRGAGRVLDAGRAREIAALARQVEAHFGGPQDIEWAVAQGQLFLLQARPMTALPRQVRWEAPVGGGWLRNFRIGEWLPEPVTPLFESWFLERCEARFCEEHRPVLGFVPRPPVHVLVNGWYFHSPFGAGGAGLLLRGLLRKPRAHFAFMTVDGSPARADRVIAMPHARRWRESLLPSYRTLVDGAEAVLASGDRAAVIALVDALADLAGAYLWSIAMVAGFAWKVETSLARFCRKHLAAALPDGHQVLVAGLEAPAPVPAHAVHSLDWFRPTVGELARAGGAGREQAVAPERHARLQEQRKAAESACRQMLAGRPLADQRRSWPELT